MRDVDKHKSGLPFLDVFVRRAGGIGGDKLITRKNRRDKEFDFQHWFKARLRDTGLNFDVGGRNNHADFCLVATTDGFEAKGLAYLGGEVNYGCNSRVPSASRNGPTIYHVFGR